MKRYLDGKNKAVALSYDQSNNSPTIAAKGTGLTARKIIELANENEIPIQQDENLVELLMGIDVNEHIPEELYQVVAEVFAYLYKLDQMAADDGV